MLERLPGLNMAIAVFPDTDDSGPHCPRMLALVHLVNSASFVPPVNHMSILLDRLTRYPSGNIIRARDVSFAELANNAGVSYGDVGAPVPVFMG